MTQSQSWITESIRFSLLGVQDSPRRVSWASLVGQEPESITNRPAQHLTVEEGAWGGGQLVVTTQLGRIDITLTAMPAPTVTGVPSLGAFGVVGDQFEKILRLQLFPQAARLAVGASLNIFPKDLAESRKLIEELLPQLKLDPDASDVMLQVNRPKKFPKLSGLVMNRLCKWAQLVTQTVQFQNNEPLAQTQMHLIKLDLDLNTSPASALPSPSSYSSIIEAFFAEARLLVGERNG
ncbi:hypothetical protein [Stutzerimonas nitrititolerans]|uniref:hypothetical protein n=1 Tax=Stutzerimonas nitrititolerans TaxID=2482751 RepID=UPI002648EAAF|nr:hypothetical protein [Stutzerimonas nitrititolerans]